MKQLVFKFLALAFSICLATAAWSQEEELDRGELRFDQLKERLGLSEEQVAPFQAELKAFHESRRAVLERHGVEMGAGKRENFKALRDAAPELKAERKAHDERLAGILDKEQLKAYHELQKEFRKGVKDKMKEKRKGEK